MSLAPELVAFLGKPPATKHPAAKAVHGYAGLAHHGATSKPATKPTEAQETPMPTGVYERKPRASKAEAKPEGPVTKTRSQRASKPREGKGLRVTRKSRQAPTDGARFGVFEDGTIHLNLPSCTGVVGTDDARALVGFLKRIGIDA